jgi:GNAT superfamily N-acetyltransferase
MAAGDHPAREAAGDNRTKVDITIVSNDSQVRRLMPLMRAYCDFYHAAPADESLLTLARSLVADPAHEGVQLLASDGREDVGFATLYWSWESTIARRVGVMNDLFVTDSARGRGVSSALIHACVLRCREHRASRMIWQTAPGNRHAQAVYDHIGATRESWIDYWLDTSDPRA